MIVFSSIREFTNEGLLAYKNLFLARDSEFSIDPIDRNVTSELAGSKQFVVSDFETAKDMAEAILLATANLNFAQLLDRTGLWAWLTYVMRDQLFSKRRSDGAWRVGELHRWYPSNPNDWQKGQRHLVRMPTLLLHSLDSNADHLLCGKPSVLPEIREQLTSQQDMFNRTFQSAARMLYFDDNSGKLKRGAGGKAAGSPRRLAAVRRQLDVTWDFDELTLEKIMSLLPNEFDRFKSTNHK